MLTLTEAAGDHLTGILDKRNCPDGVAVRFVWKETGVSLALDKKKPGDSAVDHKGRTVLFLDQNAADHLDGETVDVKETKAGGKLFLANQDQDSA